MEPKKRLSRIGMAIFVLIIIFSIVGNVLYMVIEKNWPEIIEKDWFEMTLNAVMLTLVSLPPYYLIIRTVPKAPERSLVKLKGTTFMGFFLICTALMYITNIFGTYFNLKIANIIGKDNIFNPLLEATGDSSFLSTFIYAVLIAPFIEELIFRKLMLDRLRIFGDAAAILLSGIAFGLYHRNTFQFFYATMLGFIFAYVALKTNSIRYTVILHMLINSIGTVAALFVDNVFIILLLGLWVIGSVIFGTILFIKNANKVTIERGEVTLGKKSEYILNPGSMLFVTACLIFMVLIIVV